ncbi:RNA methyltransferase [bacterium]|nr:MAG: RNA methyltransferase [bacterium]
MKFTSKEAKRSRSSANPRPTIDLIESLRPLALRSEREARGQFLVEGLRVAYLALETDCLETLLYAPRPDSRIHELVRKCRAAGVRCLEVADHFLLQLACGEDPQGFIGVAKRRPLSLEAAGVQTGVWVALESVQKPGNLGSILRTAEAAGAQGIIAIGAQIDFFEPTVVRASMGAFFAQKLVRASWKEVEAFKMRHDLTWFGTSPEASVPYLTPHYPRDFWLWMGDERKGLTERVLETCDERISIPMHGRVDSLNLGVATGVVLFGARRGS